MEPKLLIKRNNLDGIGKYFLKSGFEFFIKNEIGKAYEFIRLGLDILTCDCLRGDWKPDTTNLFIGIPSATNINSLEYHFCKAVILSYNDDIKSLYVALDAIDIYLKENEGGLGFYVKGKILAALERYSEAKECYEISNDYESCPRTTYRLGRLKEQFLEIFAVDDLYNAYMENPTSACCCRVLKEYSMKREIIPDSQNPNEDNVLIISFMNSKDPWILQEEFEQLLQEEQIGDLYHSVNSHIIISGFVEFIISNKNIFIPAEKDNDEYGDYDDYESPDYDYEPDYDEMYFDAMTDGQLGSYDDFKEQGGDLDWIDDWSGR